MAARATRRSGAALLDQERTGHKETVTYLLAIHLHDSNQVSSIPVAHSFTLYPSVPSVVMAATPSPA